MKNNWKKCKLADVIILLGGGTPKTSIKSYWNGQIPWITIKDFKNNCRFIYETEKFITEDGLNNSSTQLLQRNDIIISARGTVGELAVISKPMAFNQSCYGVRANENIESNFLFYLVKYHVNKLKVLTHGSVFDTITRDTFNSIDIFVPPLTTQRQIAKILSSLDDKIELNNRINKNLEEQAMAIFNEMIVKKGEKNKWEISSLDSIADYLNGLAMQKFRPEDYEKGIPVLKIKELRQGFCDSSSDLCSQNVNHNYLIYNGDIIFSWSGSLLVDIWCGGLCGLNQHLFKVTSRKFDKWFYYFWTKHHLNKFIAIAADKATTMGHIKREDLTKSEVFIPDMDSYKRVNITLKPMLELIINKKIENNYLINIRDTILPKLMKGEIN